MSASATGPIHFAIDTVRPFEPTQNYFQLIGWAFVAGAAAPSKVRVKVGDRIFEPLERIERPDVASGFPQEPFAGSSGFKFICYLPFGFYTGELQVRAEREAEEEQGAGSREQEGTDPLHHKGTETQRKSVEGRKEPAEKGAGSKEHGAGAEQSAKGEGPSAKGGENVELRTSSGEGPTGAEREGSGGWRRVCALAIPVSSHPILGAIEYPPPDQVITEPVRIAGWCFHPEFTVSQVVLQFGNVEVPCEYGLSRPDVGSRFPEHAAAACSGFITTENLPRGTGGMKIRVRTECGRIYFVTSPHRVAIEKGWIPKPPPPSPVRDLSTLAWGAAAREAGNAKGGGRSREEAGSREPFDRLRAGRLPGAGGTSNVQRRTSNAEGQTCATREGVTEQGAGAAQSAKGGANVELRTSNFELPTQDQGAGREGASAKGEAESGAASIERRTSNTEGPTRAKGGAESGGAVGDRNILFALYGDFSANSALHVASFANELIDQGYDCIVAVPNHKETLGALPEARFMALHFDEFDHLPAYYRDGRGPCIVHAWTTRENVRKFTTRVASLYRSAVFVHLEDNEQNILETRVGRPFAELAAMPDAELDALVPDELSHPRRAVEFLESAAGATVIVERLRAHVPAGRPATVIWPGANARHFTPRPRDDHLRAALGIAPADVVLFYHGNTHTSNALEVRSLYEAVAQLNGRGVRTHLIRTGRDFPEFLPEGDDWIRPFLIHLGHVGRAKHLPALMALADIFVQPGVPDPFNDYRFPSKLPEFFAIGRPVILPATNLGAVVRHGEDAWVLPRANAASIANAIERLHSDPELATKLAAGAVTFAAAHFSWRRSAEQLVAFYRSLTPLAPPAGR